MLKTVFMSAKDICASIYFMFFGDADYSLHPGDDCIFIKVDF